MKGSDERDEGIADIMKKYVGNNWLDREMCGSSVTNSL